MQILISYFSHTGGTYIDGSVFDCDVGNTARLVACLKYQLGENTKAFRIDTLKPYPRDYDLITNIAISEHDNDARPELLDVGPNIGNFDLLILAYPIWRQDAPQAIYSYLEYWKDKLVGIPYGLITTQEGSGLGESVSKISKYFDGKKPLFMRSFIGSLVSKYRPEEEKIEIFAQQIQLAYATRKNE